jgi:hypothetical protein
VILKVISLIVEVRVALCWQGGRHDRFRHWQSHQQRRGWAA